MGADGNIQLDNRNNENIHKKHIDPREKPCQQEAIFHPMSSRRYVRASWDSKRQGGSIESATHDTKRANKGWKLPLLSCLPTSPFGKGGGTPVERFSRTCMLYSRVAQTSFYPTKNTRSWWGRRKRQRHSTPSSIYGTSPDSSANSIDSNTTTSLPSDMYKTSRRCEFTLLLCSPAPEPEEQAGRAPGVSTWPMQAGLLLAEVIAVTMRPADEQFCMYAEASWPTWSRRAILYVGGNVLAYMGPTSNAVCTRTCVLTLIPESSLYILRKMKIFILLLYEIICCEYPQHAFSRRNKKQNLQGLVENSTLS